MLDAHDLSIVSETPAFAAAALCGFDYASALAESSGTSVRFYDVSSPGPAVLQQTVEIGPVRALGCARGGHAFAVTADGAIHNVDRSGANVIVGHVTASSISGIAVSPRGYYASVVACAKTGHVRCAPTNLQVIDLRAKRTVATWPLHDMGMDCAVFTCAAATTISSRALLLWYDAGKVNAVGLSAPRKLAAAFACAPDLCARASMAIVGNDILPTLVSLGRTVSIYYSGRIGYDWQVKISGGLYAQSAPPLPLIDPALGMYVSNDRGKFGKTFGGGLAAHSLGFFVEAPMRAVIPAGSWSFGLSANSVILPGQNGPEVVNLDRAEGYGSVNPKLDPEVTLIDAVDGKHAASLNLRTGGVYLIDIGSSPPKTTGRFRVEPASFGVTPAVAAEFAKDPARATATLRDTLYDDVVIDDVVIGLDAGKGVITIKSSRGLQRYDTIGHQLSSTSWAAFRAKAHLPPQGKRDANFLSYRGNFVTIRSDGSDDTLLTSTGRFVGRSQSISTLSDDERFAIVRSNSNLHALYSVADWKPIAPIDVTQSFQASDIAPDGRSLAYATFDETNGKKTWDIRLYDIAAADHGRKPPAAEQRCPHLEPQSVVQRRCPLSDRAIHGRWTPLTRDLPDRAERLAEGSLLDVRHAVDRERISRRRRPGRRLSRRLRAVRTDRHVPLTCEGFCTGIQRQIRPLGSWRAARALRARRATCRSGCGRHAPRGAP